MALRLLLRPPARLAQRSLRPDDRPARRHLPLARRTEAVGKAGAARRASPDAVRVGVITRHLGLPVGFGTYAGKLLTTLDRIGIEHEYVVYAPKWNDVP